jgi:uncharacterized protein YggT (Ycf19 family)
MLAFALQLVNTALSLLMWLIIGRLLLMMITGGHRNFFSDLFVRATDPLYRATRSILPIRLADRYVPFVVLVGLALIRIALLPLIRLG